MPAMTCSQRMPTLNHSVSTISTMKRPVLGLATSTWQTKSDLFKYPRISEQRRGMSSGRPVGRPMSGVRPETGNFGARIMALADRLAEYSESRRGLTCTYLSPAHRAVAMHLRDWMQAAGMAVTID